MSEIFYSLNTKLSEIFFGIPTVMLLFIVSLFISVKTGFVQRFLPYAFSLLFSKKEDKRLPLGAVCTALCATIGTGSITGTAVAIAIGGKGAVFWIWVCSFFTMAISFAEGVLSVLYQQKNGCKNYGGAVYYMEHGCHSKSYAKVFSFFCIISAFCMGNMAQSKAVATAFEPLGASSLTIGIILLVITAFVIYLYGRRITDFCQRLLPFVSVIFVLCCLIIIFIFSYKLPSAIRDIFLEAFGIKGVSGGVSFVAIKAALSNGFKRGIFSSEAGLGTTCCIHAQCNLSPFNAGLMAMLENFIDSFFVTTICALTILVSGKCDITSAFTAGLGKAGSMISAVCISLFAFATIIGWFYIAKSNVEYLNIKFLKKGFNLVYPIFCVFGAVLSLESVFTLSDTVNGILAILNICAIIFLSKSIFSEFKKFHIAKPFADDIKKNADKSA